MIQVKDNVFHINTKNTSYIFAVTKYGDLQQLYYGEKIEFQQDYKAFFQKRKLLLVSTLYPEYDVAYGIDDMCFEYSFAGNGDMRESACYASSNNQLSCFQYDKYTISNKQNNNPNPLAHNETESLTIYLKDKLNGVKLSLVYRIFNDCDCITRSVCITAGNSKLNIKRLMSLQLDLGRCDLKAITFNGAWSRERQKQEQLLTCGKIVNDSLSGASSARHNPFMMLAEQNADNFSGNTFAFNLIYSGNHYEMAEVCPYGKTRFLSGINPNGFELFLAKNESFYTPEAVMTYSDKGYNGVSNNMHNFVNKHIIPSKWQNKEKPILLNSWEAMYFDITEDKIFALADRAKSIGVELLVVDDGWFGKRNDDTTSLGDWYVNTTKFPHGMRYVADKLHNMGLKFGLWFEPEMISKNSELFKAHPDWVLGNLDRQPLILGRNQFVLDLSRKEVQEYIINALLTCIEDFGIDYIKWDFNRMLSDLSSKVTPLGMANHNYVLGLYAILRAVTTKHPDVLFELCASGGARFDLGMLCFMPIGWVSDNTDVLSRVSIQEGTSYGYPPSVMCNHISICPNHQTKRSTALQSRFSVAACGVMGLQYNLMKCSDDELFELKKVIEKYKKIRKILNGAEFYRLIDGFNDNFNSWLMVSENKGTAYLMLFQKLFSPVNNIPKMKLVGLNKNVVYSIEELGMQATGEVLMKNGLILPQNFMGNEKHPEMSDFSDFTARIYTLKVLS